jgi:hypothetical protein
MTMANQSPDDKTPVSGYKQLVQFETRVPWPLFVITLEGLGLVLITIMLWAQGFNVVEQIPLLLVLVVLWLIAEILLWTVW